MRAAVALDILRDRGRAIRVVHPHSEETTMDHHDFSDLTALYVNCTLKKAPGQSHILLDASAGIMERQGVTVDRLHLLSHDVPPGIYPDMTEHGWDRDDWPRLWPRVLAADILVVGSPIWLGEESSVCRLLIERLYAMSAILNDKGQSASTARSAARW
jgi:multimeric flavodoxin WrbA